MSLLLLFGGGAPPPAAVTGTVAQTLGNVVPTASGVYADVAGTVARTLGNVTSTAVGISNAAVTGTVAVTLGNVSGVADTEGYTTPAARITFISEHRLALPPPPDIQDPMVGQYLEYLRQHTQDAYNRLADDLARLQRDAQAVAGIANTAVYQSDSITITNSITSGDITIEDATDQGLRDAMSAFASGIGIGGLTGTLGGTVVINNSFPTSGGVAYSGNDLVNGSVSNDFATVVISVTLYVDVTVNPVNIWLTVENEGGSTMGTPKGSTLPVGSGQTLTLVYTGILDAGHTYTPKIRAKGIGASSTVVTASSTGANAYTVQTGYYGMRELYELYLAFYG